MVYFLLCYSVICSVASMVLFVGVASSNVQKMVPRQKDVSDETEIVEFVSEKRMNEWMMQKGQKVSAQQTNYKIIDIAKEKARERDIRGKRKMGFLEGRGGGLMVNTSTPTV